jgi:ketosteroid isomerase-like protein
VTPGEVVKKLNSLWLQSVPGTIAPAIREFFTDDVVIVGPNLQRVAGGRDAVAQSYDDFASRAKVLGAQFGDPVADEFAAVAVATMPWALTYEFEGIRVSEHGHEVYVLRCEDSVWKVCWRQIVSYPG